MPCGLSTASFAVQHVARSTIRERLRATSEAVANVFGDCTLGGLDGMSIRHSRRCYVDLRTRYDLVEANSL